jgi:hypothetical protein
VWLFIAAVCTYEAYMRFNSGDDNNAWIFTAVGAFAVFRYIMLRRMQLRKDKKID